MEAANREKMSIQILRRFLQSPEGEAAILMLAEDIKNKKTPRLRMGAITTTTPDGKTKYTYDAKMVME